MGNLRPRASNRSYLRYAPCECYRFCPADTRRACRLTHYKVLGLPPQDAFSSSYCKPRYHIQSPQPCLQPRKDKMPSLSGDIITTVIYGTAGTIIGLVTIYQAHKAWALWHSHRQSQDLSQPGTYQHTFTLP